MNELLWIVSICSFILIIWFNTHVVEEYATLFRLDKMLAVREHRELMQKDLGTPPYKIWLNQKYNNFFTRLIVCPFCIGVWLVCISCASFKFYNIPLAYICTLFVYYALQGLIKYSMERPR
jgi:hypothetical protein